MVLGLNSKKFRPLVKTKPIAQVKDEFRAVGRSENPRGSSVERNLPTSLPQYRWLYVLNAQDRPKV